MSRQPTTMTVIVDGKEQWREVSHYDTENRRHVPQHLPSEEVIWLIGAFHPTIVKVAEHADDDYEVCPMCELPFFVKRCTRCGYEPL